MYTLLTPCSCVSSIVVGLVYTLDLDTNFGSIDHSHEELRYCSEMEKKLSISVGKLTLHIIHEFNGNVVKSTRPFYLSTDYIS